jgi:hypothetical protein
LTVSLTERTNNHSRRKAKVRFAKKAKVAKRNSCSIHNPHTPLPPIINDDQVLSFAQWCALNALSERTGRRVLASGQGPVVTKLSVARVGITVAANRAWQHSRQRA